MSNLRLFTSNRMEILADELAGVIHSPLSSPFDKEVIVVQSGGMERWISMELALRHGICANIDFPFPNSFVSSVLQKTFPDQTGQSCFDSDMMTWRIMKLLPSLIPMSGFESLLTYLSENDRGLKLLQLSERIADIFDQYLLFRPEMVLKWEKGKENHWQAVLWRELVKGNEGLHRAALGKAFFELLNNPSSRLMEVPERVSVFGISTLPRFHMQVFASISRFSQVNLFLLNPCREYWGDISSDWEIKRGIDASRAGSFEAEDLYFEKGNSLLVSTGTLGRDFFDLINEFECEEIQSFKEPEENSLLACIQADILNLREMLEEKRIILEDDSSIRIHSCHSPMREIEVLNDRLLEMFENDSELRPGDILVMAPDIEVYAPYIQAAFDVPLDDPGRMPFSIADQSIKVEGRIIETFLALTRLRDGRFSAVDIFTILESRAVRQRFGLVEADVELIRKWIEETRIRWGIDGLNRSAMGLPDFSQNTWKAGLDRLLLGYAMHGQDKGMFADVLPFDSMEGSETSVLGNFLEFIDQLFLQVKILGRSGTLREWTDTLKNFLGTFFLVDEDTELETDIIQRMLNSLAEEGAVSGFDEKVGIDVIRCRLEQKLGKEGFGFGFISGGVTFCAMLPMRSIPFKVICLIGMNSDSYPRQSKPLGFDLMAKAPKKGDRSRRNDDRYLFLEAVLSAGEKLYISYVGQSIRDNTVIPPSVLVSEIMDYIEQGFELHAGNILDNLLVSHRLQPFSPEYFKQDGKDKRLFSYSRDNFKTAKCLAKPRKKPKHFITKGLSEPAEDWKTIDVDALCSFFVNPAGFLLNKRLGIYLTDGSSALQETEPFDVAGLDRYFLAQDLVEKKLAGTELGEAFPLTRSAGVLPHGSVGACTYDNLIGEIKGFAETTKSYMDAGLLPPLEVDLKISGFSLTGRVDAIYPERMLRYRYSKIKDKDRLRLWIQHLVLNCIKPAGYPRISMLAGMEKTWTALEYAPVEDAEDVLARLLCRYWEGVKTPAHFFPESSRVYAQQVVEKERPELEALKKAYNTWLGNDYKRGEVEDLYYSLCFRNSNPIDSEFQEIALEVYEPMIESQRKVKG